MTKEEILNKHVSLYFSSHHDRSRWNGEGEHGGAEWHTDKAIAADIYKAMDEYAKQQAIAFDVWKRENCITYDYESKAYSKLIFLDVDHTKVRTEQLSIDETYKQFTDNQFIEQQNKTNG